MSFVSFRIHVPVEPNEQEKQKIKIFLSLYPVPLVLEGPDRHFCPGANQLGKAFAS